MNIKKITAVAAALALTVSLTACGGEDGGSAEVETATATSAAETVKDETETAAETTTTAPETTTEETTTTEPVPETTPAEDFNYYEEDGGVVITRYKGSDSKVIVPGEIDGKPVVAASTDAFDDKSKITDITLPESLTEIILSPADRQSMYMRIFLEDTAWFKAKKEEDPLVIINNIVISGQDCSRAVEIPEGVTSIAACAFHDCTTVTSVTFPSTLEIIGTSAFSSCERLPEVTVPKGVTRIEEYAFSNCDKLTGIVLPDGVSYIGSYAFAYCDSLADIVLPDSVSYIGSFAFATNKDNDAIENVTFPNNAVEMGYSIFGDRAKSWIGNKTAEEPLFILNGNLINGSRCTGSVVIPDTVKSIAAGAFGGSTRGAEITDVTLPNSITKIPDSLFENCSKLKSITIPDSVTEIGAYPFAGTKIESITIPDSVTELKAHALSCEAKTVILPNGLKKMGSQVFTNGGWTPLITELTLPDSLESVEEDTFACCNFDITYKGEIYFPELYDELVADING